MTVTITMTMIMTTKIVICRIRAGITKAIVSTTILRIIPKLAKILLRIIIPVVVRILLVTVPSSMNVLP